MEVQISDFSTDQWLYLANLEFCGVPIPVSVSNEITPLRPRLREMLLKQCQAAGWIQITNDQLIGLTSSLPESIRYELKLLNTPERVSGLLEAFQKHEPSNRLDKRVMIKLLSDTGKRVDASELEIELAHEILATGDHDSACRYLGRAVARLDRHLKNDGHGGEALFLKTVLEFSNLSFAVGRGMRPLLKYLQEAVDLAESLDDERNQALGNLHLGRLEAYFGNSSRAYKFIETGKQKVEQLGDADILKAAAEFLGLHYTHKGDFEQGILHFQRAEQNFIQNEDQLAYYPVILWHQGFCLFATGQIARALGMLKNYWYLADAKGWTGIVLITRAVLGLFLAAIGKHEDARFHLDSAIKGSLDAQNAYALYTARTGQAILLFCANRFKQSYNTLKTAFEIEEKATTASTLSSLFFMDLLAEFDQRGFDPIVTSRHSFESLKSDSSIHNRALLVTAVSIRLKADYGLQNGGTSAQIRKELEAAKTVQENAGYNYLIIDTLASSVRLHLRDGETKQAEALAREILQKYRAMHLNPDQLPAHVRNLLNVEPAFSDSRQQLHTIIKQSFDLLNNLDETGDESSIIYDTLAGLLQILGMERGAVFRKNGKEANKNIVFVGGCNLMRQETESQGFKGSMTMIKKAFKQNRYLSLSSKTDSRLKPNTILVFPISDGHEVVGVSYFDNSFVEHVPIDLPHSLIMSITNHLNRYIQHLQKLVRLQNEVDRVRTFKSGQTTSTEKEPIIGRDSKIDKVLNEAQRAALSEATLLVMGETGTGKELLVNRIHSMSRRSAGPMIVLDSTTIPENLVESELFGHEKGAFTGAGKQKQGRIELADGGTLFIDEIGELPLSTQAKLLRALESKKFYRVGGIQPKESDFRLVAATHRDLAGEVAAGRFRQDLFYRLNVISCVLPPLRERGRDMILLANHFLDIYCTRYGLAEMKFTARDEAVIMSYTWPGNVRELKNVVERSVILADNNKPALSLPNSSRETDAEVFSDMPDLAEMQCRYIQKVLAETKGRINGPNGAAAILGLKRSTLYSKMYKLGIRTIKQSE